MAQTVGPYIHIDFGKRYEALREVGIGLGLSGASLPDQRGANSQHTYLYWINQYRVSQSLSPLPNLDYSGFQPALNVLAALTTH